VIKPSGGAGQRAPAASQAGPKLQNEFGLKSGKTSRTFVDFNSSFACLSVGQRCRYARYARHTPHMPHPCLECCVRFHRSVTSVNRRG
jgi:hypothetical protein